MTRFLELGRVSRLLDDVANEFANSSNPIRVAFSKHVREIGERLYKIERALDNGNDDDADDEMRLATPPHFAITSILELVQSARKELDEIEKRATRES